MTANLRETLEYLRKTFIRYYTINILTLIILLLSIVKVYVSLENIKELSALLNINWGKVLCTIFLGEAFLHPLILMEGGSLSTAWWNM